jgi:hypothetical protein
MSRHDQQHEPAERVRENEPTDETLPGLEAEALPDLEPAEVIHPLVGGVVGPEAGGIFAEGEIGPDVDPDLDFGMADFYDHVEEEFVELDNDLMEIAGGDIDDAEANFGEGDYVAGAMGVLDMEASFMGSWADAGADIAGHASGDFFSTVGDGVGETVGIVDDDAGEWVESGFDLLGSYGSPFGSAPMDLQGDVLESAGDAGGDALTAVGEGVDDAWDEVSSWW